MALVTSRTTGGTVARRLLPLAVLVPWALGVLLLAREEFEREFAVSVFGALSIFVFTILIWWNAKLLHTADIERKRAEELLRETTANLERSNTELQQFAYVASHDLFEPLRMVTSYLQLLSSRYQGRLDRQANEFIGFAVEGAQRMQALIHDLLAYSRVEMRGRPLEPVDTGEAFRAAVANLKVAIEENRAVISHTPLPRVRGDAVQLTQVFQNFIGNSLKFHGPEPPRVEVGAHLHNGEWVFFVRDNGIGIDPGNFERIWVIFQRLHTRREYAGTGMGLAICKKIIERHGGRVWVESTPGQGSTFFFTLPAPEASPVETAP
jgi:light-regulated signal transduction histidine kinase (bacteriophytochrome)